VSFAEEAARLGVVITTITIYAMTVITPIVIPFNALFALWLR